LVALLVRGKFAPPKRAIGCRLCCVARTAMPEATVHKNGELGFWKNEIWFAKNLQVASPACDTVTTQ
jgi:hypothetical protein